MPTAGRGPKVIRVVVAEDHPSIRENLRYVLDAERDMVCVGVARDGHEALDVTIQELPDVLVIDAELRDLDGIDVALRLRRLAPAVRAVIGIGAQLNDTPLPVAVAVAMAAVTLGLLRRTSAGR